MADDNERWELLATELKGFRADVKSGFEQVSSKIDQTNERLDQTNERLDQTNERLDQTNIRLDAAINMVRDFRKDVSSRFDGIGLLNHEERLTSVEKRLDRLEEAG